MISNALALFGLLLIGVVVLHFTGFWWLLLYVALVLLLMAFVAHQYDRTTVATAEVKRR